MTNVVAQLRQVEVAIGCARRARNHVVKLAKQVEEEDRLVVEVLQAVHLLLIKVVHLRRRNYVVVV